MWTDLVHRYRALFRRRAVEADLDEELRFHLEQHVAKHMKAGLTREGAERQISSPEVSIIIDGAPRPIRTGDLQIRSHLFS